MSEQDSKSFVYILEDKESGTAQVFQINRADKIYENAKRKKQNVIHVQVSFYGNTVKFLTQKVIKKFQQKYKNKQVYLCSFNTLKSILCIIDKIVYALYHINYDDSYQDITQKIILALQKTPQC